MCRQSVTPCLVKPPALDSVLGLPVAERLVRLDDPRRRRSASLVRERAAHRRLRRDFYGIAVGLRDDLKAGWVESVVELVHADMYSDYLEMAESLLDSGYKDPAAVITGTSLEVHVRALCVKHSVDIALPNRTPKKADSMNADLKKVGVYDGLQQKRVLTLTRTFPKSHPPT